MVQKIINFKKKYIAKRREELHKHADQLIEEFKRLREHGRSSNSENLLRWLKIFKEEISSPSYIYTVTYLFSCRADKHYNQLCESSKHLNGFRGFSTRLYELGQPILIALILQKAAASFDFLKRKVKVCSFGKSNVAGKCTPKRPDGPVHAEIYLVELFCRSERRLIDDDDFIGCSKPACYCCRVYIEKVVNPLRGRSFFIEQAHDKIYTWCFPETRFLSEYPQLTSLDDQYLSKALTVMAQSLDVKCRKAKNGKPAPSYPDISVGLPSLSFGGRAESNARRCHVVDDLYIESVFWRLGSVMVS